MIYVKYSDALPLIEEGDVLLFRGKGFISWLIKWAGKGKYSHVAMASWRGRPHKSSLELCEIREFRGGRIVDLKRQVKQHSGQIDVYRLSSKVETIKLVEDEGKISVRSEWSELNGCAITTTMREISGIPYGWRRIWKMARYQMPFIRWFFKPDFEDKASNGHLYLVCSTAVASAIRQNYVDIMPNISDMEMQPSDLSRCRDLHYLFTLVDDNHEQKTENKSN